MIQITAKETKPFGSKFDFEPLLFSSEEKAISHIDSKFPSASEITQRLKESSPLCAEDIPRTWFVEIPSYDTAGEWDYSTEYTFTVIELEVK